MVPQEGLAAVRAKVKVYVPAHSARIIGIQIAETLECGQEYHFEPRAHPTLSTTSSPIGPGRSRGIFEHDQSKVLFINFNDMGLTIFEGTTVGYLSTRVVNHNWGSMLGKDLRAEPEAMRTLSRRLVQTSHPRVQDSYSQGLGNILSAEWYADLRAAERGEFADYALTWCRAF